jgi:8-amino-7-oxononanoate synthase
VAAFEEELAGRLRDLEEGHLLRQLRRVQSAQSTRIEVDGRTLLNFSSNDYLGLATHPRLREAATEAIARYGTGSGASRLICGSIEPHHALEETLARFKGTDAALSFSSGYATALGCITALVSIGDIVVIDKLVHASIVDAARLSGAKIRVFRHNDVEDLESILQWSRRRGTTERTCKILIATESIFSMDGDVAPLNEIVALKDKYGAWLLVDEAHATGLFGRHRRGLCEEMGVSERVEAQMGTLGKALGSAGGYIAGSRVLVDYLINKARSFIFSTAPVPAAAAAAQAGVEIVRSAEGKTLLDELRSNVELAQRGIGVTPAELASPIVPIQVGDEVAALELAKALLEEGALVPAIRYPTVARGKARLRLTLSAKHRREEVQNVAELIIGRLRNRGEARREPRSSG